jgi:hypothetical protein
MHVEEQSFLHNCAKEDSAMKKGTRFGTWNVRSLYRAGTLTAAARELARFRFSGCAGD